MTSCAICLTPLLEEGAQGDDVPNLKSLRCGHLLHVTCCEEWFLSSGSTRCPLCRRFHNLLTSTGQMFLSIVMIDLIRFALVSFMAYQYYMTGMPGFIFLYILVDALVFFQCVQSDVIKNLSIEINLCCFTQRFTITDLYMFHFGFSLAMSLAQLRLWLPSSEFFIGLCLIIHSLYTSISVVCASINS